MSVFRQLCSLTRDRIMRIFSLRRNVRELIIILQQRLFGLCAAKKVSHGKCELAQRREPQAKKVGRRREPQKSDCAPTDGQYNIPHNIRNRHIFQLNKLKIQFNTRWSPTQLNNPFSLHLTCTTSAVRRRKRRPT